jgi:hypothetical protein
MVNMARNNAKRMGRSERMEMIQRIRDSGTLRPLDKIVVGILKHP